MTFYQFMLQLLAMLILSGVLSLAGLLIFFTVLDWWQTR